MHVNAVCASISPKHVLFYANAVNTFWLQDQTAPHSLRLPLFEAEKLSNDAT
jgi:hypothetical protein